MLKKYKKARRTLGTKMNLIGKSVYPATYWAVHLEVYSIVRPTVNPVVYPTIDSAVHSTVDSATRFKMLRS